MRLAHQLDPGHTLQRLVNEQQRDPLASLAEPSEHVQSSRWGVGRDDLIIRAEPSLKHLLQPRQHAGIVMHHHQRRLGHAYLPVGAARLPARPSRRHPQQGLVGGNVQLIPKLLNVEVRPRSARRPWSRQRAGSDRSSLTKAANRCDQLLHGREVPTTQRLPVDDRKEHLNQVEPDL